ncbi:MAG: ubiquinol-cytochrome c reductase iron-sulfur subunit [Vulcanimicrobiaceae bacterium]
MAVHEAESYKDPGTPQEQTRRTFMANVSLGVGGIVTLVVGIPCLVSLIPSSLLSGGGQGTWAPLTPAELTSLQAATKTPVKLSISFKYADGYMPPAADDQFVWGIRLSPAQQATFQKKRPDLFADPTGKVDYPVVNLGFVIFSSICPHLGCHFDWVGDKSRFICPCHGSEYGFEGQYLAGPAPRGLDPLPFREQSGTAQITWIQYKQNQPSRLIVSYS